MAFGYGWSACRQADQKFPRCRQLGKAAPQAGASGCCLPEASGRSQTSYAAFGNIGRKALQRLDFCLALAVGNMRIGKFYGNAAAHLSSTKWLRACTWRMTFSGLPPGCATGKQGPYALHSRFDRFLA